jgi:outer membrane protein assembly factor BamB
MTRRALIGTFAAILACSVAAAEDWPQFRGPTGQGLSTATGLPAEWDTTRNVTWKVPVPGKAWSSPVVYQDRVYLTTAVPVDGGDKADQSLRALCLDAASGTLRWQTEVFRQFAAQTDRIHGKNSHASPTPIVDGRNLYLHFGTNGTACLDLRGNVIWRNQELKYTPVHGSGGSPALVAGVLVISCDGAAEPFVVALDQRTGRIRWRRERPPSEGKQFCFSTPAVIEVDGQTQVVSAGPNCVLSYDPRDGREIWRVGYEGYSVVPRPVFGHGLVFVCTGYDRPSLLAIRPDGRGDVTATHVVWRADRAVALNPSLLLVDRELYMVSDNGIATCFDAPSGTVRWQQRLGGNFSASPVYADGKVYFQSEEGDGIVIRAGTAYEELARNPLGERTLASYAVADGAIFLRSQQHLYRIEQ